MLIYSRIKLSGKSSLAVRSRGWGGGGSGERLGVSLPKAPGNASGARQLVWHWSEARALHSGLKNSLLRFIYTPNDHRNTHYVKSLHLLKPSLPRLYFCLSDLILAFKTTMNFSELDFICISACVLQLFSR